MAHSDDSVTLFQNCLTARVDRKLNTVGAGENEGIIAVQAIHNPPVRNDPNIPSLSGEVLSPLIARPGTYLLIRNSTERSVRNEGWHPGDVIGSGVLKRQEQLLQHGLALPSYSRSAWRR